MQVTNLLSSGSQVAFVFPGQGSQFAGMGHDLYHSIDLVRDRFDQASEFVGEDLAALLFGGDSPRLTSTEITQVTVFTLSTAIAAHLEEQGVRPWAVAGHSLGEYSALVVAGSLSWEDGLRLVWQRGLAMTRASAEGRQAMAAISGPTAQDVSEWCAQATGEGCVVVANYNSPRQTVISGDEAAVLHVMELANAAGLVKTDRLSVGGAFHSPHMETARWELDSAVDGLELALPRITMVSSMTGQPITDIALYKEQLRHQITLPVCWHETAKALKGLGVRGFLEVGPGRVLTGLVRQCDRSAAVEAVGDLAACDGLLSRVGPMAIVSERS